MENKVDYHFHSYYSDGTMKPTELVKKYKEEKYDIIALTDHDGIDGIAEAMIAGEALEIQVVTGIELSTDFFAPGYSEAIDAHILGYQFDVENEKLIEKCKEIMAERRVRNEKLLKVIKELGYELQYEDLIERKGQKYIGKPNFARALVRKGYIDHYSEAFEPGKLLESPEAKAVKKVKMTIEEAMELIKQAGGIPVLAHPMEWADQPMFKGISKEEFFERLDVLIRHLKKSGLKGVECYHPSAADEDSMELFKIAQKYHLHVTRGSDFHGDLTK